ncbi:MAG: hypothetical protein ACFB6S_10580 [Geminicoccaceae bacterium]
MWWRAATGGTAIGIYGWRVHDPKGSYALFYDVSNWLTGWVLTGDGAIGYARNLVNLILVDQADGFLLGMAFFAVMSILLWPVRAGAAFCVKRGGSAISRLVRGRSDQPRTA